MKYILPLLLITNISFGQEWTKIKIDNYFSIEFPSTPEKTSEGDDLFYTSNEHGFYSAIILDLDKYETPETKRHDIYDECLEDILASKNGEEILKRTQFEIDGIIGEEVIYLENSDPKIPNLRTMRVLLINRRLLRYEFWSFEKDKIDSSASKEKFFNSVSINVAEADKVKNRTSEYSIGNNLGKTSLYLLLVILMIPVILIFRRFASKKNKNVG